MTDLEQQLESLQAEVKRMEQLYASSEKEMKDAENKHNEIAMAYGNAWHKLNLIKHQIERNNIP